MAGYTVVILNHLNRPNSAPLGGGVAYAQINLYHTTTSQ